MAVQAAPLTIFEALEMLSREVRVERQSWANTYVITPNGWTVSVGYGYHHACESRFALHGPAGLLLAMLNRETREWSQINDAEIAIFTPDGSWFEPHGALTWGFVPADHLLAIVDAVALYRDGGPCPCPDCVRERRSG